MISAGSIVRNNQGWITWPDGSNIAWPSMRIFDSHQSRTCLQDEDYEPYPCHSTPQEPDPVSKDNYIIHNGQVFVAVRGKDTKAQGRKPTKIPNGKMIFWRHTTTLIPAVTPKPTEPLAQEPRIVLPPPLATYEQPPAPFNPFDDKEIMEDISSDSSQIQRLSSQESTEKSRSNQLSQTRNNQSFHRFQMNLSQMISQRRKSHSQCNNRNSSKHLMSIDSNYDNPMRAIGEAPMTSKKIQDYLCIICPSKFIRQEELVNDKVPERAQVNSVRES